MEEIFGYIENITYSNDETGFTVAKLKEPRKKDLTPITGALFSIQPGESIHCQGHWKRHPQHGLQFEVVSFTVKAPSDVTGMQKYLESGMIKGIGPVYAKRIVDCFGIKTLEIIDQDPEALHKVPGIGKKRVEQIGSCWGSQRQIRDVMIFLRGQKTSPLLAQKIFKIYGEKSIDHLKTNPYAIAKEIRGIGFKTADQIARNLGIPDNSAVRIEAGIEHTLWELSQEGHVCYPHNDLLLTTEKRLCVPQEEISICIKSLVAQRELIEKNGLLWIKSLYFAELGIAKELFRILQTPGSLRKIDLAKALPWVEKELHIDLAKGQKEAVAHAILDKVHIITGGPGTGKSTITKAILAILSKLTKNILLAAPTGKAAKRLSSITGTSASTIHSLLEMSFEAGGFKRNEKNPLNCDLIILDEVSMIDTKLMYHLLKAIPTHSKILFTGDIDQLPSVGPGNVLKDLIDSTRIGLTQLKEVFRQAKGSSIITNAHKINQGEFPDLSPSPQGDFFFIQKETPEEILECIVDLVSKRLPQKYHFDRFGDIQVLTPMKRGPIGTENLNIALQKHLNPSKTPLLYMGREFHVGDKVMQIRNNYHKEVFNGDVGHILSINSVEHTLDIVFEEKKVSYPFSDIDELVLSYAVSIHKYQGSESPCVIIPMHMTHFTMLQRNLLYTAITRGRRLVVLVGTKQAISSSISNDKVKERHTQLRSFLLDNIP